MRNKIISKQDESEYFDDCAICQAMKKAEETGQDLTVEELETVFAKQNLKNRLKEK